MKKQIIKIGFLVFGLSLVFLACKDDDTTAPVIRIQGSDPYNLELLDTYVDQGATAEDDQDGDISSSIVRDESEINNKLPGSYSVHYEVSDAAGNFADAHREVVVFASAAALAKTYSVIDTVGIGVAPMRYDYNQTVTVSGANIKFSKFADYSGNTNIVASIASNGTITMSLQQANSIGSLSENHTFQGTGKVTATGFYLEYIDTNLSQGSASATCHAYFTR